MVPEVVPSTNIETPIKGSPDLASFTIPDKEVCAISINGANNRAIIDIIFFILDIVID
jgi:hypothetical protein